MPNQSLPFAHFLFIGIEWIHWYCFTLGVPPENIKYSFIQVSAEIMILPVASINSKFPNEHEIQQYPIYLEFVRRII